MAFDYSQELMNDYEKLLEIDKGYDVIIYAGEDEVEIYAHSLILCIRSQYFRAAFSNEWANKKDGKFILNKPNISPQILTIILRFIYCGRINLTELQGSEILNLLIAVDELNVQILIQCIQDYLINYHYDFLQQNSMEILETAYQFEAFTSLWNYCLDKICENPAVLLRSDKFINLKKSLLELILKRDDLLLDEIVIWDNLIKWSFDQHPSIQKDVKKWNKEEITIMERTLHNFIPLIRFYHMSSEDFLSKELNIKIQQPPRSPKYDSIIINSKHFAHFSSWIKKKDNFFYNESNNPYDFKLLFRASRDGKTPADFHAKCDNKGTTIVILKIPNLEQILGGYNPINWNSNCQWKYTSDSFIFSFTNRNNFRTAEVGYIKKTDYDCAIHCHQNYGPAFGEGYDLYQDNDGNWKSFNSCSYYKINIPLGNEVGGYNAFNVEDYEVFQVVNK
ncbi:BTB/POZ domain-containing protein [Rhizophagus irregularis DAOM 181602=DAOM 197198]|nr:BTB/POZ domain-containing protein [Rhizophagus irregularis DAOM 181602=DAOM 197198]